MAARWQPRLEQLAREFEVPGASLAVWHRGTLETAACGVVNLDTGVATTPDTLFQIGSITKLLTGMLTLQLVEAGRVEVDKPIREYVADFALADGDAAASITVRQLLCHTSGIDGDYFENTGTGEDKLTRYVDACRLLPMLHAPGECFSYCNVGFNLLGRMVELARGTTWESALGRQLLRALGAHSFVRYPHETPRYRVAIGHVRPDTSKPWSVSPIAYLPLATAPAGSVVYAAASDLVLLARTVLDDGIAPSGERVLSANSLAAMLDPQIALPSGGLADADAFGLAFMLFDWNGTRVVGHDGATIGQNAYLRIVPGQDTAVALFANGGYPAELSHALFGEIFARLIDVAVPPRPVPQALAFEPRDYCGVFEKLSQRITVNVSDSGLIAELKGLRYGAPPRRFALQPFERDAFVGRADDSPTPATFRYVTLGNGRRVVSFGGRVHPEMG